MRALRALLDDVFLVVLHVAAVEHGVLRRADVDERRLHARKHVLHTAEVDVPVDLGRVVGRLRHVVLDERTTLEHRDLRGARPHVHAHEVATDRASLALAASLSGEGLLVDLERAVSEIGGDGLSGLRSAPPAPATPTAATASGRLGRCGRVCCRARGRRHGVANLRLARHEDSLGYLGIVDLPFHRAVRAARARASSSSS